MDKVVEALSPSGLLRMKAPHSVHATLRKRDRELFVHFINLGTDRPQSPSSAYVERVPDTGPVTMNLPIPARPESVRLEPGARPVDWIYTNGMVQCSIGSIGIHDILVLRQEAEPALHVPD